MNVIVINFTYSVINLMITHIIENKTKPPGVLFIPNKRSEIKYFIKTVTHSA